MHSNRMKRMTQGYKADIASKGYEQRAAETNYSSHAAVLARPARGLVRQEGGVADQEWTDHQLWQSCFTGVQRGRVES